MQLDVKYNIQLTPHEFRLVCAGLRGTLKPEWQQEARELQDRLFQERKNVINNWSTTILGKEE